MPRPLCIRPTDVGITPKISNSATNHYAVMYKRQSDRVVDVQLFNDSFPHRDVIVGAVETHVVDVADQPQTLRNADACCTYQQPSSELPKHLRN